MFYNISGGNKYGSISLNIDKWQMNRFHILVTEH